MSAATTSAAGRLTDGELKAREKAARKAEKARLPQSSGGLSAH